MLRNDAAQKSTGEYELLYPCEGPLILHIKEWYKFCRREVEGGGLETI